MHVEQDDVGLQPHGRLDGVGDGPGLPDDVDRGAQRRQLRAHAGAEQPVVVDQQHPHRVSHAGTVQPDLGALAGGAADDRAAAVPGHPADDRAAHALPVGRDVLGVEAGAPVAHEDLHPVGGDLGVQRHRPDAGVPGGVDHRLAGGRDEGEQGVVGRGVADHDRLDGDAVRLLDLGGGALQRGGERDGGGRRGVQPAAQLALLGAGQPGDLARVVGGLADEREGLQHRVVHVGGDLGPLLRADPLAPLGGQVGGHPHPPGAGQHDQPDDGQHRRQQPVARGPQLAPGGEEPGEPGHQQPRPGDHGQQPTAAGRAEQPGPGGGVGLLPDEHHPAADGQQGQQRQAAEGGAQQEQGAEAERAEGQRLGERAAAGAARALRQEQPPDAVEHHAEAARHGEHHEGRPHREDRHPHVHGDAARHPAERAPLRGAQQAGSGHAPRLPPCGAPGGSGTDPETQTRVGP